MRVLVTGGAGFIGSHVIDAVRAAGHQPVLFDLVPSPHHAPGEIETITGSVLDTSTLAHAMSGCHAVAHLAAAADVDEVAREPARSEELNSRGTLNVLEAARSAGVGRVLYASTIWVYGASAAGDQVDEETALGDPEHLYTATKLAGEMYCRSYASLYGLDWTILRFGIPYGPRARAAAVVPALGGRALAGEALTIAGTGEQCRRFVYVEDLAAGVACALRPDAANRVYNLVGEEDVSIKQIVRTVSEIVGDVEVCHVPARAGDFKGVEVSGIRARRELGWCAQTPFADGVRRYVDWRRNDEQLAMARAVGRPTGSTGSRLRGRANRDWIASAGLFVAAEGLLGAYLIALRSQGVAGLRTVLLATVIAVVLVALSAGRQGTVSAKLAWITAGATMVTALVPSLRPLLGLDHLTATVALLALAGAGFSVALALGGLRQLASPRDSSERPAG